MPRDEVQAAYFALLRAREELETLHRYEEYLTAELERVQASEQRRAELAAPLDRRLRRGLHHTDETLAKAAELRIRVVQDELRRLPSRIEAAAAHVEEAEQEHEQLRRSA